MYFLILFDINKTDVKEIHQSYPVSVIDAQQWYICAFKLIDVSFNGWGVIVVRYFFPTFPNRLEWGFFFIHDWIPPITINSRKIF